MAVSICIKIGKIQGESAIKGHEGEIDVLSWNWGLTQSASAHVGSGAGSGSADVKDLRITKYVDKASPILLQECFKGSDQTTAVLTVIKVGGKAPVEFVKITMDGTVFLSSVSTGDPLPNDRYTETVTLNFSHVKFEYTTQNADQSKGASVAGELHISQQS
jgi:type VI secretion system secreted protein Hcp